MIFIFSRLTARICRGGLKGTHDRRHLAAWLLRLYLLVANVDARCLEGARWLRVSARFLFATGLGTRRWAVILDCVIRARGHLRDRGGRFFLSQHPRPSRRLSSPRTHRAGRPTLRSWQTQKYMAAESFLYVFYQGTLLNVSKRESIRKYRNIIAKSLVLSLIKSIGVLRLVLLVHNFYPIIHTVFRRVRFLPSSFQHQQSHQVTHHHGGRAFEVSRASVVLTFKRISSLSHSNDYDGRRY
ncbi:hypothetical protein PUN28_002267 [Cardiocondyla obscurior]|uniref:Secreted protein n=1 Tax=Cardiocondyla obscurior TaxID=286306 RepID=A0AAW2GTH1_9HYME